jgi:hypothetical protein
MTARHPSRILAAGALVALAAAGAAADTPPPGVPDLVWAAYNGRVDDLRAQLDAGAKIDTATASGALPVPCVDASNPMPAGSIVDGKDTALHWAAAKGPVEAVKLLLERGAAQTSPDNQGFLPLHLAACAGRADVVEALVAALPDKAAVDEKTDEGIGRFLSHNTHAKHRGKTALHFAAMGDPARFEDFRAVARVLLKNGADANAVDTEGDTPLHYAAQACNKAFAGVLLREAPVPASADLVNLNEQKPADLARARGCEADLRPLLSPSAQALAGTLKAGLLPGQIDRATKDWDKAGPGDGTAPAAAAGPGRGAAPPAPAGAAAPPARGLDSASVPPPPGSSEKGPGGFDVRTLEALGSETGLAAAQRQEAVHLLNLRHDPALIPYFTGLLKDPAVSDEAAAALASILSQFKGQGADWSAFNAHAADVIGPLGRMPEDSAANELYRKLLRDVTLMPPEAQDDFLKRFSDVDLLLMLGYNTADQMIDETHGLHSDAAKKIFAALQDRLKSSGATLDSLLDRPELRALPKTVVRVLTQLFKYDLMSAALSRPDGDAFAAGLPARLFPADYKEGAVGTFEAYGIGEAVMSRPADAAPFVAAILKGAASGAALDPAKSLLFLKFHERELSAADRETLDRLWSDNRKVPGWVADKFLKSEKAASGAPPVYAGWPSGGINVLLVMTQAEKAGEFIKEVLHGEAPEAPGASGMAEASANMISPGGKRIHVDVEIFGSDKEGWASTRTLVTDALIAGMNSPKYQAVFYRGHVGDYDTNRLLQKAAPQYKAFGDLGCYSDIPSARAVARCPTCAYFGTTVVSQAERTNGYLPLVLDALGDRLTYDQMDALFAGKLKSTHGKFTGSYDPADRYASDLIR